MKITGDKTSRSGRGSLARGLGFALVTILFAVTHPLVLAGICLAVLLMARGPRDFRSAVIISAIVVTVFLGDRSGLWWFERGWPLLLSGVFVWLVSWRAGWSFSAQALATLGLSVSVVTVIFLTSPGSWLDVDTLMAMRAAKAADMAVTLLGDSLDDPARIVLAKVVDVQVALFPAILAVSSLGALGLAVTLRAWLAGEIRESFGRLRGFRFNDHLVWVWLAGLALVVAPVGQIAERVGGNALFFMGALYVLRGLAVLLSFVGGISVTAGIIGSALVVLLYPVLALVLLVALIVGLGDTWLNLRGRFPVRENRSQ